GPVPAGGVLLHAAARNVRTRTPIGIGRRSVNTGPPRCERRRALWPWKRKNRANRLMPSPAGALHLKHAHGERPTPARNTYCIAYPGMVVLREGQLADWIARAKVEMFSPVTHCRPRVIGRAGLSQNLDKHLFTVYHVAGSRRIPHAPVRRRRFRLASGARKEGGQAIGSQRLQHEDVVYTGRGRLERAIRRAAGVPNVVLLVWIDAATREVPQHRSTLWGFHLQHRGAGI